MKQLKDYLHLYLGCEYIHNTFGTRGVIGVTKLRSYNSVKPILRPLSDMTEDEKDEFHKTIGSNLIKVDKHGIAIANAVGLTYLLSKHFDLFGLIDAGLAIDRTKLNSELSDERSVESKDSQRTNAD